MLRRAVMVVASVPRASCTSGTKASRDMRSWVVCTPMFLCSHGEERQSSSLPQDLESWHAAVAVTELLQPLTDHVEVPGLPASDERSVRNNSPRQNSPRLNPRPLPYHKRPSHPTPTSSLATDTKSSKNSFGSSTPLESSPERQKRPTVSCPELSTKPRAWPRPTHPIHVDSCELDVCQHVQNIHVLWYVQHLQ